MKVFLSGLIVLFGAAAPQNLSACTVCFGGAGSDLSRGFFWGILLLLLLPLFLFGMIAYKVIQSSRKKVSGSHIAASDAS